MANRVPKKVIIFCVILATVFLVFHGVTKEYSLNGVLQSEKASFLDPVRIWRNSYHQTEPRETSIISNLTRNTGRSNAEESNVGQSKKQSKFWNGTIHEDEENVMKLNNQDANEGPMVEGEGEKQTECTRRNNIGFFKMHKCSSSTVQNILMRYGDRYDLNFVLPPAGNYLGQTYFQKQFAMSFPVKEFNILCHHTRFSREGFESILPSDAAFVTIIRDPATMFESTFTYLNYPARYGIPEPNALATFLANPSRYYYHSFGQNHAKDSMLYDLGLPNEQKEDQKAVDKKIRQIAQEFDLVMMTEYFAESLILLKDLMCWDFEDIAYFKINARSKTSVKTVTDSLARKTREWNRGDTKLYNHFNRTFWEKVQAFGEERMRREVTKLEEMNQMMRDKCVEKVVINDKNVWHPAGINVESLRLKPSAENDKDCQLMVKTELPFTTYIRQKQLTKYFGRRAATLL
ncbi:galactosylceramide sulfotransferase-like [Diadema antillarum]|uniref:galactosylceramide sulfotransferase-like n=1 Tax=Diadema antillarum TaxID=105358 RepID=UPI003A838816